ncbi:hypothetical protein K7H06_19015 [Crassaminicella profunda]|nr:hypothetical protein K7H06_19015 [Crassaminicella profunda]
MNSDLLKVSCDEGGTVYCNNSKAVLETTAALPETSITAKMETVRVLRYQSGLGAQARFTAIFTTGVANSTQLIGIGDTTDGFFFGYNGTTFGILRLQNGTPNWTDQSNWNGDKVDSTGDSGVTLDTTKGNVYTIQYQWLGFGVITFWIANPTTGDFILVHTIRYPNNNTTPSIYNPTLPLMAKVEKTSGSSNIILQTSSGIGLVEGPIDYSAIVTRNSVSNSVESINDTETNIITIKNNNNFQEKTNRVRIRLDYLSVSTDGSKPVTIKMIKNATVSGDYTDINENTSVVSYNKIGTLTATTGTNLLVFKLGKAESNQLFVGSLDIQLEPGSTFTVSAVSSSGSGSQVDVGLSWIELW